MQDLGLQRLRDVFGLIPKEYPTTRQWDSSLEDRARDIMTAFGDPTNKAVFASIGGFDEIRLIKYLDSQVFLLNPKPFFGFSDNTHLHNFLWNLGIPSYYGVGIMNQIAFQGSMQHLTVKYLKQALFHEGELDLDVRDQYNDEGLDWSDKENLNKQRKMEPNDGLFFGMAQQMQWVFCGVAASRV